MQGTWKLQSFVYNGEPDTLSDCQKQSTIEFKSDDTAVITDISQSNSEGDCSKDVETNTYEVLSGSQLNLKSDIGFSVTADYKISGDTLTFTIEFDGDTNTNIYVKQ